MWCDTTPASRGAAASRSRCVRRENERRREAPRRGKPHMPRQSRHVRRGTENSYGFALHYVVDSPAQGRSHMTARRASLACRSRDRGLHINPLPHSPFPQDPLMYAHSVAHHNPSGHQEERSLQSLDPPSTPATLSHPCVRWGQRLRRPPLTAGRARRPPRR